MRCVSRCVAKTRLSGQCFHLPLTHPTPRASPAAGGPSPPAVCAAGARWSASALACQSLAPAACLPAAAFTLGAPPATSVSSANLAFAAAPWAARANGSLGAAWWPAASPGLRCTHLAATARCTGDWSAGALACSQSCPAGAFGAPPSCAPCAPGHYCPPGTLSWAGLNCGRGNFCPQGSAAPQPCPVEVPPGGSWGALVVQGPAFLAETAACKWHCFWNFSAGAGGKMSDCRDGGGN